jgi:hypothetical protein
MDDGAHVQTAPHDEVMTWASTAILVPVEPANAAAVGTTQKALLGLTAHASSAPSPRRRGPRVPTAAANMTQSPAANASGPRSCPAEVNRHAAANESVAAVIRICARRTTRPTRGTRVPARAAPHPTSPRRENRPG